MRFRALVKGVWIDDRPLMIYGGALSKIKEWAANAAKKYRAPVEIYVTEERLLEIVEAGEKTSAAESGM